MVLQMPGHFTEELNKLVNSRFKEVVAERYQKLPTMIPELAHVEPLRPGGEFSLYRERVVRVEDMMLEERWPGDAVQPGSLMEARHHVIRTRTYSKDWTFPRQVIMARGLDWMRSSILTSGEEFGRQLALLKERELAKIFNKGGLTAGHAIFNNHVPGTAVAGISNGLAYDGKPLFNLTGNARTNWIGSSYYNAEALSLSAANLTTVKNLINVTNAKDELDRQFQQRANTLLVSPQNEDTAKQIVTAMQYAGSANYGGNPHADLEILSWNLLEDTDAWYLLARSDQGGSGRGPEGITFYDDGEVETFWQHDQKTDSVSVMANVYFGLYAHNWRGIAASNLQTS